ncbi:hypothetical protein B0H10DRAFT_2164393 [Mycena sp. CBHHK59/15]|nr:hypothetical protein B0H10DRAFT_2164393 [Mycena sp. CBHHK59/15]
MQLSELTALGVFCSYFSIIIALFGLLCKSLFVGSHSGETYRVYVFVALTAASFGHTWFLFCSKSFRPVFMIMQWSFTNYENLNTTVSNGYILSRMSRWLIDTSLFEQAWARVCFGAVNWWWSQQLCLYTVGAWTILLATEGRRHQTKFIWAYMLLGQLVAISVASNLFYLSLVLAKPRPAPQSSAPPVLWIPVLISLGTVATSPFTDKHTFLPNLLLMHSLCVIPLLFPDNLFHGRRFCLKITTLYVIVFAAALAIHTRITSIALGDPPKSVTEFLGIAWDVLNSHPAQSSICWDVIWTSLSFIAWIVLQPEQGTAAY